MSNQKINLVAIAGIQEIDDCAAESVTGGAFAVDTGEGETQYFEGDSAIISISDATKLGIVNTGPGADDPNASGHNFRVVYNQTGAPYSDGIETVSYGNGVTQFDQYKNGGSDFVKIDQFMTD